MEVTWRRFVLYFFTMVVLLIETGKCQLCENFYAETCPMVETLVKHVVYKKVDKEIAGVADMLRLYFHDCMVEGCDASIMIESQKGDSERNAPENQLLDDDGFDMVIEAKKVVESVCPGVVSCADILAIATRDCVVRAGGPWYNVDLGRRDGHISRASRVARNIPKPTYNLQKLTKMFVKKNISQYDMIALSGAHTVGVSHCKSFADRLYSKYYPSLNSTYAKELLATCPKNADPTITINMDPDTPNTFDNVYYKNILAGKGLLTSDVVLHTYSPSREIVTKFANNPEDFNAAFIAAMRKLGHVGVKVGNQGEIRRDCTSFN